MQASTSIDMSQQFSRVATAKTVVLVSSSRKTVAARASFDLDIFSVFNRQSKWISGGSDFLNGVFGWTLECFRETIWENENQVDAMFG